MAEIRKVIENNRVNLCKNTIISLILLDTCVIEKIITPDEREEIVCEPKPYNKKAIFYNSVTSRASQNLIRALIRVFQDDDTLQNDEIIHIFKTCLDDSHQDPGLTGPTELRYSLQGSSPSNPAIFQSGISYHTYTCIQLNNLILDIPAIVKSLTNCVNLEQLIMNQISLTGESGFERAFLPKLKNFVLNLVSDSNLITFLSPSYRNKKDFQSVVFIENSNAKNWNVENILDLDVDIDFSFGGKKNFVVHHTEGFISSSLTFSIEILKNLKSFRLKKLALQNCDLDFDDIRLDWVTSLNFNGVHFQNGLGSCLKSFPALTHLSVWNNRESNCIYVSDLPKHLMNLTIEDVEIKYSPGVVLDSLDIIYLNDCKLDEKILKDFSSVFNSKGVSINPCKQKQQYFEQMHPLLKNILENANTTWIRYWLDRCSNQTECYGEIENVLTKLNLRKRDNRFLLRRGGNQQWLKEATLSREQRDIFIFQLFGGSDFMNSYSVFRNSIS